VDRYSEAGLCREAGGIEHVAARLLQSRRGLLINFLPNRRRSCDPVERLQFVAQGAQEYPPIDAGDQSEASTSQIQITIVHAYLNLPRCCKRATSSEIRINPNMTKHRLSVHFRTRPT
jgi:hypothetical protein